MADAFATDGKVLVEGGKKHGLPETTFVILIRKNFHDIPWHKL